MEKIAAELAIRNLVGQYADAVNRRDKDDWAKVWAEDGVWVLPDLMNTGDPKIMKGRNNVVDVWYNTMQLFSFVMHIVYSGTIDVQGDTATSRWYISENLIGTDGEHMTLFGVYNDENVKVEDKWLYKKRVFRPIYTGPADLSGQVMQYTD
jgi:ketosteroid isomerase-like protein